MMLRVAPVRARRPRRQVREESIVGRMTRTQITLEEEEYRFVKSLAAEGGASFSSVMRSLVRARMEKVATNAPHVWEVAGLITRSDFSGRDHDTVLYEGATRNRGPDADDLISRGTPG
jgi:hypothetical protein